MTTNSQELLRGHPYMMSQSRGGGQGFCDGSYTQGPCNKQIVTMGKERGQNEQKLLNDIY